MIGGVSGTKKMDKAVNEPRVHDMYVRAVTDRLFGSIDQIPKRLTRSFYRNGKDRPDSFLSNDNINPLALERAEYDLLFLALCSWIEGKMPAATRYSDLSGGVGEISSGRNPPSTTRRMLR
jgi:hypothetical protein